MQTPDLARAFRLFVAAFGSLAIAMALGLHNPFWAAMPVWVVSQPFREDLLIRGILRVLGTLAGAAYGVAILHLGTSPEVLLPGIALGAGLGVGLAFWIGTVYSYGALLFAMTTAVVLLPVVASDAQPLGLALDRVACTLIGVVVVTLVTFFFTPSRGTPQPLRQAHKTGTPLQRGLIAAATAACGMTLVLTFPTPEALGGALAICIFGCLVSSMPDPRMPLKFLVPGVAIAVIAALSYRGILTVFDVQGLVPFLAITAVFLMGGALLRANPKTAPLGLDSNMCFLLAAEVGQIGHPLPVQAVSALALLGGACLCVLVFRPVLRPNLPAQGA
ncbi:FUSC family protein [Pseudooceanicola sp. CBS1P-1]|uniref:FUSC family protein n=1 Tax=Pseudooceanicola albus TaxID=2692189 RepID=A0A6L7G4D9_9RHOB|nr:MULTISPECIES: FUSC family protein [Pseudooceanicola]MBT9384785.1 FUSC family protein [Pseudooceanicola endophyticus]MXN18220.1 hypothetical protein [Pseudooceanicola albus]